MAVSVVTFLSQSLVVNNRMVDWTTGLLSRSWLAFGSQWQTTSSVPDPVGAAGRPDHPHLTYQQGMQAEQGDNFASTP